MKENAKHPFFSTACSSPVLEFYKFMSLLPSTISFPENIVYFICIIAIFIFNHIVKFWVQISSKKKARFEMYTFLHIFAIYLLSFFSNLFFSLSWKYDLMKLHVALFMYRLFKKFFPILQYDLVLLE